MVLYHIPLLYKLTERNLYYIQVALPTRCIYKVHVFGYIDCTYYNYNSTQSQPTVGTPVS